jgi:uncharacterized protein RhaS with RHS repeats
LSGDLIGLEAGVNVYAYVTNAPLKKVDPQGLDTYRCEKALSSNIAEHDHMNGPDFPGNPSFHQYDCVTDWNTVCDGNMVDGWSNCREVESSPKCVGLAPDGLFLYGDGVLHDEQFDPGMCEHIKARNKCFEDCLKKAWSKPAPTYGWPTPGVQDCKEYTADNAQSCAEQCRI